MHSCRRARLSSSPRQHESGNQQHCQLRAVAFEAEDAQGVRVRAAKRVAVSTAVIAIVLAFGASGVTSANAAPGIPFKQVATSMLAQLRVAPEQQSNTYERTYFGGWGDADADRCNTRKEVLIAESTTPVTVTGSCTIQGGSWQSPYDGGQTSIAGSYDIDHMVPLKEAWVSGAFNWNMPTLRSYANDLGYEYSLVAVSARSNRQKSDQDPATWMPSNTAFACEYVGRWIGVKYRWDLSVDAAERDVLSQAVNSCGTSADVAEPVRAAIGLESVVRPSQSSTEADSSQLVAGGSAEVFANCAALNAVYPGGVAQSADSVNLVSSAPRATKYPLTVNAELYAANASRDRDKDGVACER